MTPRTLLILFIASWMLFAGCADDSSELPTVNEDTTSADAAADTSAEDMTSEDTTGEDTTGLDTTGEDATGEDTANGDTSSGDTGGETIDGVADDDGDGIPNSVEGASQQRDSDNDGTPDYLDADSDDNGVPDSVEGAGDTDGNGIEDFRDFDNDGDGLVDVLEIVGGGADCNSDGQPDPPGTGDAPRNCRADTPPDYLNPDSDSDTISDRIEGSLDTDGDGWLDRYDSDSDGDGLFDRTEGTDDPDGDGLANFRDPDSDDDGLTDDFERNSNSDVLNPDTDGDGVTDLIEFAAGTDPTDSADNPRESGDFVFTVPYEETPDPLRDTLQFRTAIRAADIYFTFDTSTTMQAEMDAMRNTTTGVPAIINALLCEESSTACVEDEDCGDGQVCGPRGYCASDPDIDGCLLDLWTGVGSWDHIDSYVNLLSLQSNPAATASAIPDATQWWVAPIQPPACVADPSNCTNSNIGCASSGIGCPGFRDDAVPIYIQITDAANECGCGTARNFPCDLSASPRRCSLFTTTSAGNALANAGIRFIGLIGDGPAYGVGDATTIATQIGTASGSVDSAGNPFIYSATDAAVVNSTVQAVQDIVTSSEFDITITATDEPDDAGDALQFIERLEVNTSRAGCAAGLSSYDTDSDNYDDAFSGVTPGQRVCWDVVVKQNDTVPPTREPQVFRARLTVSADGSVVDSRIVYFLVPADTSLPLN